MGTMRGWGLILRSLGGRSLPCPQPPVGPGGLEATGTAQYHAVWCVFFHSPLLHCRLSIERPDLIQSSRKTNKRDDIVPTVTQPSHTRPSAVRDLGEHPESPPAMDFSWPPSSIIFPTIYKDRWTECINLSLHSSKMFSPCSSLLYLLHLTLLGRVGCLFLFVAVSTLAT